MPTLKLEFVPFSTRPAGVLIVFCDDGLKFGSAARAVLDATGDLVTRAAEAEGFKPKHGSALEIVAPAGLDVPRLVVIGVGKVKDLKAESWVKLGGVAMGKIPSAATEATIIADLPGGAPKPERIADMTMGMRLRAYTFDRYKTRRKDDDQSPAQVKVGIAVSGVAAGQRAFGSRDAIASGVLLARDLVNEPPNVLFPEEFARRTNSLKKFGVAVEILDVPAMKKLGMNALLGVGKGSGFDSRMVVMSWKGGKEDDTRVAVMGKEV